MKKIISLGLVAGIFILGYFFVNQYQKENQRMEQNNNQKIQQPETEAKAIESSLTTLEEVKKHNTKDDCWVIINNEVFDLTNAIDSHPGGAQAIIQVCGGDGTKAFQERNGKGPHSKKAQENLKKYKVGDLAQ